MNTLDKAIRSCDNKEVDIINQYNKKFDEANEFLKDLKSIASRKDKKDKDKEREVFSKITKYCGYYGVNISNEGIEKSKASSIADRFKKLRSDAQEVHSKYLRDV